MEWKPEPPREQIALDSEPYDRWVSPIGASMAEFHRSQDGYLLRFLGQADFEVTPDDQEGDHRIVGWPVPGAKPEQIVNLYHNAIQPLLGNHTGGLFLHGSAVSVDGEDGAIAFLGLSRGGKTTLAGSFAAEGNPFITEDVIDLVKRDESYWLQPKRSKLRLFADSARFLLGEDTPIADKNTKQDVEAGDVLPFAREEVPLRQIYILGTDHRAPLQIRKLALQEALSALMPHAFLLDVEDKARLKGHFTRMADLVQDVDCFALDFTRDYAELPQVRAAVLASFAERCLKSD